MTNLHVFGQQQEAQTQQESKAAAPEAAPALMPTPEPAPAPEPAPTPEAAPAPSLAAPPAKTEAPPPAKKEKEESASPFAALVSPCALCVCMPMLQECTYVHRHVNACNLIKHEAFQAIPCSCACCMLLLL